MVHNQFIVFNTNKVGILGELGEGVQVTGLVIFPEQYIGLPVTYSKQVNIKKTRKKTKN